MDFQRFFIGLLDSFADVEDDACEAVAVEVDFLVVWNLADVTGKLR